jgi:hypothetical protein
MNGGRHSFEGQMASRRPMEAWDSYLDIANMLNMELTHETPRQVAAMWRPRRRATGRRMTEIIRRMAKVAGAALRPRIGWLRLGG